MNNSYMYHNTIMDYRNKNEIEKIIKLNGQLKYVFIFIDLTFNYNFHDKKCVIPKALKLLKSISWLQKRRISFLKWFSKSKSQ